ncbi:MAG: prepilin-type N-terminal cleavage/methylation domain-containing protein [Deltaproteobacteria bacterium]|nr:prepilin-type N-terminal cleavage/methylation domain-containing protein [Deltaproteobacteria bacterium]
MHSDVGSDLVLATCENKGFSLLDLLIVIMILGILGVFLAPQLHSTLTEARLNEATGELVSGLHYAQSLAVTHQRPFGLAANVAENWFRVFDHQYRTDANPHHNETPPVDGYGVVLNPMDKKWYTVDFDTAHPYEGVSIDSVPASGGMISFYPDGHSSVSDSVFVLGFGGEQRTITVDGIIGKISVN